MKHKTIGWFLVAIQIASYVVLALLPWRTPSFLSVALAIPFVVIGIWLGFTAFGALGTALTPTPVPVSGAGLRTHGPYARVRHPIYTSVLSLTLAALILAGTTWSWAWGGVIVVFFWSKSRWEDRLLAREYGAEWNAWARRTGAFIPRRRRSVP